MNMKTNLFLIYFILRSSVSFSQYLPENGIYHYLKTEDGIDLYVLEVGNKDAENTYIVLHGGFGAEHSYLVSPLIDHSDKNRFIFFDQRGSLRSPAPDSLIIFRKFVNDIEQIRKEFKLPEVNILAHSNGSTIALDYLYHHSDKVKKLILIGCPLSIIGGEYFQNLEEPINKYRVQLELWQNNVNKNIEAQKEIYNLKDNDTLSGIQQTLLQKILYAANHTYLMTEIEKTENAFFNPDVFKALQQNMSSEDWAKRTSNMSEALAKSLIPIYLINGEHDFVDPLGHVWKELDKQVEHLKYTQIKNAGHNIWLDQPKEFKEILKQALN
jgi:proline iminopeptidase